MSALTSITELDFDSLEPISLPVKYKGKKFVLREASEDAACKWRNSQLRASRLVDGKLVSLDGMADTEPLLVSLCLFEKVGNTGENERPVSVQTIRSWTPKVVSKLFEEAKRISGLEEKDTVATLEEKIKKLQEELVELKKQEAGANGKALDPVTGSSASSDPTKSSPNPTDTEDTST